MSSDRYKEGEEEEDASIVILSTIITVDNKGAFLSSVDLFFANIDPTTKITVQVRPLQLGIPTENLVAIHAEVALEPSQIVTSADASIATNVKFPSPVYLEPEQEYCIVLLAPTSNLYEVWCAHR